jgi:hypothetical protein
LPDRRKDFGITPVVPFEHDAFPLNASKKLKLHFVVQLPALGTTGPVDIRIVRIDKAALLATEYRVLGMGWAETAPPHL